MTKVNKEIIPVQLEFSFDSHLLYLIQDVTKKDSIDILAFFNDLSRSIAELGVEKRTGMGIKKKLVNFFPNTSIPFFMVVEGRPSTNRRWVKGALIEDDREVFRCHVEVGFPEDKTSFPTEMISKITEALLERDLLGHEGGFLQPFDKPEPKESKMYKKMMEDICGKQASREVKPGYDPDITGICRNCDSTPSRTWHPCKCDEMLADASAK
jgi:hypothetical protein